MALRLEEKKALVAEVKTVAESALSCVGADYRGLSVTEMDELRKTARQTNVYLRVVKNTLARRAVEGTDFECVNSALEGPMILAFAQDDPAAAARLFKNFAKGHEQLAVKMLAVDGKMLPVGELDRLAELPTREEALGQLAGALQAPIAKFVRTMAEPHAKLVRLFGALRDQKQAA